MDVTASLSSILQSHDQCPDGVLSEFTSRPLVVILERDIFFYGSITTSPPSSSSPVSVICSGIFLTTS